MQKECVRKVNLRPPMFGVWDKSWKGRRYGAGEELGLKAQKRA